MAKINCKQCKFFNLQGGSSMGNCQRYPDFKYRHETEWCGEFTEIEKIESLDKFMGETAADLDNLTIRKPGRPKLSVRQKP